MFYWILDLFFPVAMLLTGFVYHRYPPYDKNSNPKAGYRSKRSMRSKESWDYAHKTIAKLYLRFGVVWGIIVYGCKTALPFDPASMSAVFTVISLALVLIPLPVTESLLKRKFR